MPSLNRSFHFDEWGFFKGIFQNSSLNYLCYGELEFTCFHAVRGKNTVEYEVWSPHAAVSVLQWIREAGTLVDSMEWSRLEWNVRWGGIPEEWPDVMSEIAHALRPEVY